MVTLVLNFRKGNSTIQFSQIPTWEKLNPETGELETITREEVLGVTTSKRVCVLIHGYRVKDAFDGYTQLLTRIAEWYDVIVLVQWPGGCVALAFIPWVLKWVSSYDVFDRANKAGGLVAQELAQLAPTSLTVQTHSLGARVALSALKAGLKCKLLLLTGPAVPRGCLSVGGEFYAYAQHACVIVVASSKRDRVLWAYVPAEFGIALGTQGPTSEAAGNVHTLDCSSDVAGHSDYKRSNKFLSTWKNLLCLLT